VTEKLSQSILRDLSGFLAEKMGLHFPEQRWQDLQKGLAAAAGELGCGGIRECAQRMLAEDLSKPQIEVLASRLTVGETYFFRDRKVFGALEELALPELIRRHSRERRLRLWSAGCATGEEPYSLAILLRRLLPGFKEWKITILATDINPRFLERAREGVYSSWSFRDCPSWLSDRYFVPDPRGSLRLNEEIKKMVTFSYHNLAEDTYPAITNNTAGLDLILCRNVLMYFSKASRRRVAAKMFRCLVEGGYLFVGPSELSPTVFAAYRPIHFKGVTVYRKELKTTDKRPQEMPADPAPTDYQFEPVVETTAPVSLPEEGPAEIVARQPPAPKRPPAGGELEEARVLYAQSRYADAARKIREVSGGEPITPEGAALLARAYANLGMIEQGLAWARQAAGADKLNPALHYLAGMLAEENNNLDEAAAALRRAVYLDSGFVLAHFSLGNLARRLGRSAQADKHFANALASLARYDRDEIVPESEGITAGRLEEIIRMLTIREIPR
jgi:chemotaxis protein methyltransferase CheR